MIYFDHNATAPLHPAARQAWLEASETLIGNPSSPHRLGNRSENELDQARQKLANILECRADEIIWTSGATESSNHVLQQASLHAKPEEEIWVSAIEHPAAMAPAQFYFPNRVRFIPVTTGGVIDLDWVTDKLKEGRPRLLAVMAANNETGVLQPWQRLAQICREKEISFFCDAVQWVGKLPARGLGACDFVSGSAHKFGGPRGVGFLKVPAREKIHPFIRGGKQQDARRAGTENVPGVIAMVAALSAREEVLTRNEELPRLEWRRDFERQLSALSSEIVVAGETGDRLWNTCLAFLPNVDCRFRWVVKLDKAGFAVSTGSACASGEEKPSHVLSAMNYPAEQSSRAIRFSSGWETTRAEWDQLLAAIKSLV